MGVSEESNRKEVMNHGSTLRRPSCVKTHHISEKGHINVLNLFAFLISPRPYSLLMTALACCLVFLFFSKRHDTCVRTGYRVISYSKSVVFELSETESVSDALQVYVLML